MKILYTNFHSSPNINGHTTYITTLSRNLITKHSVHVATPPGSALHRIANEIDGVIVHDMTFYSRLYRLPSCASRLRSLIVKEDFDVIHVNGSADHKIAMVATRFMKRKPKIVFTKHNDMPVKFWGSFIRSRFGTDAVIAVCAHVENILQNSPYGKQTIFKVLNGISTDHYAPVSEEQKTEMRLRLFGSQHTHKIIIGSNAGTSDYKNWMDMVRAVSSLDPMRRNLFHVAIAGGAITSEDLREIEKLGMLASFTYAGMLDDVRCFISSIDIGFVLSSRVETISFACREMMSCAKPVIVAAYSGLPENITEGKDGWVVGVNSTAEVSRILSEIADQKFDFIKMGLEARGKAQREFGLNRFIRKTEDIYMVEQ
ncbi:glycosyltransferase [Allopusillimonas ginsengisoli]|uniref:glycosyltransferase n=1 Tax=Allopusillimonas ginsengisoli TaxID=453575 RepID=UPI0039C2F0D4